MFENKQKNLNTSQKNVILNVIYHLISLLLGVKALWLGQMRFSFFLYLNFYQHSFKGA